MSAHVTPEQQEAFRVASAVAGYRSVAEWIAVVLEREIELLAWSNAGLTDDPTPPELRELLREAESRAKTTWPPKEVP